MNTGAVKRLWGRMLPITKSQSGPDYGGMLEGTSIGREEQAGTKAGETAMDPAVTAAALSVALSWYFFFLRGDRHRGLFVGLWPPTILAFASYFKQTRMSDRVASLGQGGSVNVVRTIEDMMRSR